MTGVLIKKGEDRDTWGNAVCPQRQRLAEIGVMSSTSQGTPKD